MGVQAMPNEEPMKLIDSFTRDSSKWHKDGVEEAQTEGSLVDTFQTLVQFSEGVEGGSIGNGHYPENRTG